MLQENENLWLFKLPLCENSLWQILHEYGNCDRSSYHCVQMIVGKYYINMVFMIYQVTIVDWLIDCHCEQMIVGK